MVKEEVIQLVCRICERLLPSTNPSRLLSSKMHLKSVVPVPALIRHQEDSSQLSSSSDNIIDNSRNNLIVDSNLHENSRCRNLENEYFTQIISNSKHRQFLYPKRSYSGWKSWFLASIVVLIFVVVPIMANPLPMTSSSLNEHHRHHKDHATRLHSRPAKFINPCRLPATAPTLDGSADIQSQPDVDIFHNIITQSTKALRQAEDFINLFYKEAFGVERSADSKYEDIRYDFLADTTEKINQFINDGPSNLNVEEQIRFLYQSLQKFAVGLEAIVLDQACYGQQFYYHFNEAEYQLKYVLCELQIAMLEKNIEYTDITRDIMAQEYRDIEDKTVRNIRDYVIFRDYIKALQYVNTTFQHFHNQARQEAEKILTK